VAFGCDVRHTKVCGSDPVDLPIVSLSFCFEFHVRASMQARHNAALHGLKKSRLPCLQCSNAGVPKEPFSIGSSTHACDCVAGETGVDAGLWCSLSRR
jgi:hypothetical protein